MPSRDYNIRKNDLLKIFFVVLQVCLMSQSWHNVASMHDHLLTVHAHKT